MHHTQTEDVEPALLLVATKGLQSVEHKPRVTTGVQHTTVYPDGRKVVPELHLTGGGELISETWYLGNDASNHMTSDFHKFKEIDEGTTAMYSLGMAQ